MLDGIGHGKNNAGLVVIAEENHLLDLTEARRIIEGMTASGDVDLSAFREATCEAIEALSKEIDCSESRVTLGLLNMDEEIAKRLALWKPLALEFSNLQTLDESSAMLLSKSVCELKFNNLHQIDPPIAKILATVEELFLVLEGISLEAAKELCMQKGKLCLHLNTAPDKFVLRVLSHHAGETITIEWPAVLESEPFAFTLPNEKAILGRVETFVVSAKKRFENVTIGFVPKRRVDVRVLPKQNYKHLDIFEAKRVYDELSEKILEQDKCIAIPLEIYESAEPVAMEYLASRFHGHHICFGLRELSVDLASILCRYDIKPSFMSLDRLCVETAGALAESKNSILFFGVMTQITPGVAKTFSKFMPELCLSLDSLCADFAEVIVDKPGKLGLWLRKPPAEEILHILCEKSVGEIAISWPAKGVSASFFKPTERAMERKIITVSSHLNAVDTAIHLVRLENVDNCLGIRT